MYSESMAALKKAVKTLYTLRRSPARSCEYDGPQLCSQITCSQGQPDYELSVDGLKSHRERGRQPIDVILMLAYQLGYSCAKAEEKPPESQAGIKKFLASMSDLHRHETRH